MTFKRTILQVFILLAVVAPTLAIHIPRAESQMLTPQQVSTYAKENDYSEKMNEWLDKLSMAESNDDPNLVILDVNNRLSMGEFQYQQETWNRYSKKYGIKANIMNPEAQRQLTYDIVKYDPKGWTNWWTSCKKKGVGLPPSNPDVNSI